MSVGKSLPLLPLEEIRSNLSSDGFSPTSIPSGKIVFSQAWNLQRPIRLSTRMLFFNPSQIGKRNTAKWKRETKRLLYFNKCVRPLDEIQIYILRGRKPHNKSILDALFGSDVSKDRLLSTTKGSPRLERVPLGLAIYWFVIGLHKEWVLHRKTGKPLLLSYTTGNSFQWNFQQNVKKEKYFP